MCVDLSLIHLYDVSAYENMDINGSPFELQLCEYCQEEGADSPSPSLWDKQSPGVMGALGRFHPFPGNRG